MKKWLAVFIILSSCASAALASNGVDYEEVYRTMEVPAHRYVHDIDPGEYYDTQNTTWSPYPLLRLTGPLYFKTITIEPGYYALTPRKYEDNWYMLFKEAGRIKYILPVYERDIVPELFYDENLPKPKLSPTQKIHLFLLDKIGTFVPSAKRKPAPQTYLEMTDLDNNFVSMVVYWGSHRYYMIFRTINL